MDLGERIAEARKTCRMTQADLSETLGRSIYAVRKWEQGQNEPSLCILRKIAEATKTPFAFLVGANSSLYVNNWSEACPLHYGVEALRRDKYIRQLWNISDTEIAMLRNWQAPDPHGNLLHIETIPQAITLLQHLRSLSETNRESARDEQ